MNKWHCDICCKETFLNPPTEPQFDEVPVEIDEPVLDAKGNVTEDPDNPGKAVLRKKTIIQKTPRMGIMKQQDVFTGKVVDVPVQVQKDLALRAIIVKIKVGYDSIQRDFCPTCLENYCGPEVKALWQKLEKLAGIE